LRHSKDSENPWENGFFPNKVFSAPHKWCSPASLICPDLPNLDRAAYPNCVREGLVTLSTMSASRFAKGAARLRRVDFELVVEASLLLVARRRCMKKAVVLVDRLLPPGSGILRAFLGASGVMLGPP
jgi:hypothetical protein